MTKKEENPQNLNISFKIKLIKKQRLSDLNKGIFTKLKTGNRVAYNKMDFSLKDLEEVIGGYFKNKNNEHRKKFSFRSKVFKQTYKFR